MITEGRAREIASWFASPGTHGKRFAEFATTGMIQDLPALLVDIEREHKEAEFHLIQFRLEQLREYLDEE